VNIAFNITVFSFPITTKDDDVLEYDESFTVVAYPHMDILCDNYSTLVTIENDDCKLLNFANLTKIFNN